VGDLLDTHPDRHAHGAHVTLRPACVEARGLGAHTRRPPDERRLPSSATDRKGGMRTRVVAVGGVTRAVGVLLGWLGYLDWPRRSAAWPVSGKPTPSARAASVRPAPTATALPTATATPAPIPLEEGNWATYLGGPARSAYAASATQLTAQTVAGLKRTCKVHGQGAIFSQPVIVNGRVYWGAWDGSEHASYTGTGNPVWSTSVGTTVDAACQPSAVGVARPPAIVSTLLNGTPTRVEDVGGGDGTLYALNAWTGSMLWRTRLGASPRHLLWSAPAAFGGSVSSGVAACGDCPHVQGAVVRVDGTTGAMQDGFKVVPDGDGGDGGDGDAVWGSLAVDLAAGARYCGTGDPGDCSPDEPYTASVVALRSADRSLLGSWQVPAYEQVGDGDFGAPPTRFTATIGGQQRALVGIANTSGRDAAFDQAHLSAGPVWETRVADTHYGPACGTPTLPPADGMERCSTPWPARWCSTARTAPRPCAHWPLPPDRCAGSPV
jgi:outer membrane protein assembly factor BamB